MKIGVAGTDRQREEDRIMQELETRDLEAVFLDPRDVSYLLKDGDLSVRADGRPVHNLDLLFMRRTRFDVQASRDLIGAMDAHGIRTVERKEVFFNPLSKFHSLLSFVDDGVEGIGYPLIVKPVAGREGEGVERLDARSDLSSALDGADLPVLLQDYLDIEAEYRVLVVGGDALGTVVKEGGEGVARNYAQGADFLAVDRPSLESAAVRIAQR
ncbi:MAG: RimK family alpha-L-glutamate ligase, partial [Candidatus Nanohaloarchaea archaeon]